MSQTFLDRLSRIYPSKRKGDFPKMSDNNRMTITEVARAIGVVPKTIVRWEKFAKVKKARRDWRGWRVYTKADLKELEMFRSSIY